MPITQNNVDAIRYQIGYKLNYNVPYYATRNTTGSVITDMDQFPYKRYFRGVYYEDTPTIFEREAGWRPRHDECYTDLVVPTICKPNYCWEYPCSTCVRCKGKAPEKDAKPTANYTISP
jgi:hypothetical protein